MMHDDDVCMYILPYIAGFRLLAAGGGGIFRLAWKKSTHTIMAYNLWPFRNPSWQAGRQGQASGIRDQRSS
jgi:hypothetical protein